MNNSLQKLSSKQISVKEKSELLESHFSISLCNVFPVAECLKLSVCRKFLFSGHQDGTIRKWDLEKPGKDKIVASHRLKILSIAINSFYLVSSGQDRKVKIWKTDSYEELASIDVNSNCLDFLRSSNELIIGAEQGLIFKYNLSQGDWKRLQNTQYKGPDSDITCVLVLSNSNYLFIGYEDGSSKILDPVSMKNIGKDMKHGDTVNCAVEIDSKVITGSMDSFLHIWLIETQELLLKTQTPTKIFISLCVFQNLLIVTSLSNVLKFYYLEGLQNSHEIDLKETMKNSILVNSLLFYTGSRRLIRALNLETMRKDYILTGHKSNVISAVLDKSNQFMNTCGRDNTIRVWDLEKKIQIKALFGHKNLVRSACFTDDSQQLISISDDKTLKVWDLDREEEIKSTAIQTPLLKSSENLAFNKNYISYLCNDFSYQLWRMPELKSPIRITRKYIFLLEFKSRIKLK